MCEKLWFSLPDAKELHYSTDKLTELSRRGKEANIKPYPDIDIFMKVASMGGQKTSVVTDYILIVCNFTWFSTYFFSYCL